MNIFKSKKTTDASNATRESAESSATRERAESSATRERAESSATRERAESSATRERAEKIADQIAEEFENITTNGNRTEDTSAGLGSAQRTGPDRDKARDAQPPDAKR